jgi:hypothetical protein
MNKQGPPPWPVVQFTPHPPPPPISSSVMSSAVYAVLTEAFLR